MGYYNLILHKESAIDILNEIGGLQKLELIESGPNKEKGVKSIDRAYSEELKWCEKVLN